MEICGQTIQEEQLPFRVVHNGSDARGKGPIVFEDLVHFIFFTVERVWAGVYGETKRVGWTGDCGI